VLNSVLKPPIIAAIMRILSVIIILATVGLAGLNNESQAQTVRDDSGETYFLSSVRSLCGPRAQVYLAPHSAKVCSLWRILRGSQSGLHSTQYRAQRTECLS